MSKLIRQLKEEHQDIVDALMRVKVLKVCSDDGQRVLMNAKDMLLEHLKKEDDELYPMLKRVAVDDEKLAEQLKEFEADMARVSKHAFEFFQKYSADMTDNGDDSPSFCERLMKILKRGDNTPEKEFLRDFETLYDTLMERVRKEEAVLYAVFDNLAPK